jgi:hypothetical protein
MNFHAWVGLYFLKGLERAMKATINTATDFSRVSEPACPSDSGNPAGAMTGRSRNAIWAGRVVSGIAVLFLTMDAAMKLFGVPAAVEGTRQLGYPANSLFTIGLIQAICLGVYLIPRTAPIGAILWTGYLGGAIATHLRLGIRFSRTSCSRSTWRCSCGRDSACETAEWVRCWRPHPRLAGRTDSAW